MKDIQFKPENVTVKVGQTVTWTNDDPVAHTVTAKSGADFDSGTVSPGGRFAFAAKKAGKISYVCTIHPNQKGTITVS
jgi:plastocyanin